MGFIDYSCPFLVYERGVFHFEQTFHERRNKAMPSKKVLAQKEAFVVELANKLQGSVCGVVADYKGITVSEDTVLRKSMREANVDYFVVKNSLLSRAFEKAGLSELNVHCVGETALALSKEDIIIAPKLVHGQVTASKGKYSIKAGFIEGKPVDSVTIIEYAQLPSKEVLVSKLLFMLQSPVQRLAIALSEIAKKDGGDTPVAEEAVAEAAPAVEEAVAEAAPAVEEAVAEAPAVEAAAEESADSEAPAEEAPAEEA
jgi:large subunit ribosomal protein L10